MNEVCVQEVSYREYSSWQSITVPFPDNLTGPTVVKFKIPAACRPGEVYSNNTDPRILGLQLSTMFLTVDGSIDTPPSPIPPVYFDFGSEGRHPIHAFQTTGFSGIEAWGRWTEGEERVASITISLINCLTGDRVRSVLFENVRAFRQQIVTISLNNEFCKNVHFFTSNMVQQIVVPFPSSLVNNAIVSFKIPGACQPGNGDSRILGLAFSTLAVTYEAQIHDGEIALMGTVFQDLNREYQKMLNDLQAKKYCFFGSFSNLDLEPMLIESYLTLMRLHRSLGGSSPPNLERLAVSLYLFMASTYNAYGVEQLEIAYPSYPEWIKFFKDNEEAIKAEIQARKDSLEYVAKHKGIKSPNDERHFIQQFIKQQPKYSQYRARMIYCKFMRS